MGVEEYVLVFSVSASRFFYKLNNFGGSLILFMGVFLARFFLGLISSTSMLLVVCFMFLNFSIFFKTFSVVLVPKHFFTSPTVLIGVGFFFLAVGFAGFYGALLR